MNKYKILRNFIVNFLILAGFFVFSFNALALTKEDEVKAAYRDVLDREPTGEELQNYLNNHQDILILKKGLNKTSERDAAIAGIYQRALKRNPQANELAFLKNAMVSNNAIRKQLFNSPERVLAIKDLYSGLLGREPEASASDFYFKTRSDFSEIKKVLNDSQERENNIKKIFKEELDREPTESEMSDYLKEFAYLSSIRKDLENVAKDKPPVIVNVETGVNEIGALIIFDVNKKSKAKIEYGPSKEDYIQAVEIDKYATKHDVLISDLKPETVYYYRITVVDRFGNQAVKDGITFQTRKAVYISGVPFYAQENRWNGGPAAVQMLLEYYGVKEEQSKIAEQILVNLPLLDIYFSWPDKMISYIKSRGLIGTESYSSDNSQNTNLDYLKQKINEGKPVLVKTQTLFSENYKILLGYNDESKEFILYDPAKLKNTKIKYDEFLKDWSATPIYNPLYKNWSFVIEKQ